MEFGDDLASLDKRWDAGFDGCDGDGFRFRERVPPDCHKASDRSGRWDALEVFGIGLFSPTSACCPFADDAQRPSEAARRQTSPEFSAVAAPGSPLLVEPWQMHIQGTLPCPEDVVAFAADYLPNQLPAVTGLARDLLDRYSAFRQPQDRRVGLFPAQIALVLDALGRRSSLGSILVAPMTLRTWRIDLRTASRKARLAFSIRCQRSATCTACGRALAAASPYPPPRSRAMIPIVGGRQTMLGRSPTLDPAAA